MRRLLWKEWHEQSWKLFFSCIVLGTLALIGLRTRLVADQMMILTCCGVGILLLPLLVGSGLIPSERAEGSFESLIAMPIAPWRILLAKTFMGLLLCVGPMVVAVLISLWIAGGREMSRLDIMLLYFRCTLTVVFLFFWVFALTSRLPSEARAGLVAVGVMICWMILTMGLDRQSPRLLFGISPLAFVFDMDNQLKLGPAVWLIAMFQLVITAVLWVCMMGAFRKSDRVSE